MRLGHALGRGGVALQPVGRPDRPGREAAATVRAAAAERALGTVDTERALERADPGELAVRRQVPVAALAVRAQVEHRRIVDVSSYGSTVDHLRDTLETLRRLRSDVGW